MNVGHIRRSGRPRWPYLLGLLLAIVAVAIRFAVLNGAASGAQMQVLQGTTGQGTAFELGVERGRVRWLTTVLNARCAGGTSWKESWSPTDGAEVHLVTTGTSFTAWQRTDPSYSGGTIGRIGFSIYGTITGRSTADGTIRLVARFYRGEEQWNACDSLDVAWAAGHRAPARLKGVTLGYQVGDYYPAVPSLAVDVSPARQRFIDLVDQTCTQTYNWGVSTQRAADLEYQRLDSPVLRESAYYAAWHAWQLRAIRALGQPPQARILYDAWLANFSERVSIEQRALVLYATNDPKAAEQAVRSLTALKARGNLLGQRFGLVRCTSNGDRTPIPILNDGQPLPLT